VHGNTTGAGITISGVSFDSDLVAGGVQQVNGGNLPVGVSGNPVGGAGLALTSSQGNLFFANLNVFAASGTGLQLSGPSLTFGVTPAAPDGVGTSTIDADNGAGADITSATIDLRLADLDSTTAAGGVNLSSVGGQFRAPAGSSITKTSGVGTAFTVANSVSGTTVTYAGTLNVTSGAGVSLTSNTGSTITFSGGITLSTGASAAFAATGGGTVTVTGAANTLTTTTGTALTVTGTTIGASGLQFQSISAGTTGTPVNGIVLNTTGSSGGLTVTGTGSASSGGTIQNTTGNGITLASTRDVSLTSMNIQTTGGSGIDGTGVTNFSFVNGSISGAGNASFESAIAFNGSGSGVGNNIAGTVTVTGNTFTNPFYSGLDVQSNDGTVTNANVSNNTITNPGFSGVNLVGTGTSATSFNLQNATINQNNVPSTGGNGIQISIGNSNTTGPGAVAGVPGDATKLISITNNSVTVDDAGTQAITVANSGGNPGSRTKTNFLVQCNGKNTGTCTAPTASALLGSDIGTVILIGNNGYADMTGIVNNNVIDANHMPNFGGGNGIAGGNGVVGAGNAWTPDLTLTVTNNTITDTDGNGILLVGRGTSGIAKLKIANNSVAAPINAGGFAAAGIRVDAGNSSSADDRVYLNIFANTSAGSNGAEGIGIRKQGSVSTTNDFGIFDAAGGPTLNSPPTNTEVETFLEALNPAGGGAFIVNGSSFQRDTTLAPP
jgi:hypothetical protein